MRNKLQLFIIALFLTFAATCWGNGVFAQITPGEHPHPVFDGVERVFIYVHYVGLNEERQQKLPAPLRQKNIEALLLEIYKTRFSSKDCGKLLHYGKMYGCNDQPVEVRSNQDYWQSRFPDSMKPGTLNVLMQIRVSGVDPKSIYHAYRNASYNLINDRADPEIPTRLEITFPNSVSLHLSEKEIEKAMRDFIKSKIR